MFKISTVSERVHTEMGEKNFRKKNSKKTFFRNYFYREKKQESQTRKSFAQEYNLMKIFFWKNKIRNLYSIFCTIVNTIFWHSLVAVVSLYPPKNILALFCTFKVPKLVNFFFLNFSFLILIFQFLCFRNK